MQSNKNEKIKYIMDYSVLFLVTALFVFWPFFAKSKTFIYSNDGYYQHYNSLVYYGNYLRGILSTLINEHRLVIPMLDMSIGLGSDVLTTLHYYVIGDPLYLLTVFVPTRYMEYFFGFLIVFRMYLAGLAFSAYALYRGNSKVYTALGSIIYCFSGYMLVFGTKHIMFEPAAIYLPLIILGIEKIYKKEKPYLFIAFTAIAAASNFFFFYMIVCFAVIYAIYRYIVAYSVPSEDKAVIEWWKDNISSIIKYVGVFIGYGIISLGMASVILLPAITAMTGSERMGVKHYLPILYEWKYYVVNFSGFMTSQCLTDGTFYTAFGFSAMGVLGVVLLIASVITNKNSDISIEKKVECKNMLFIFCLLLLFSLIPVFGYVFSGFSYVNNRWSFAFAGLVAYIFIRAVDMASILKKNAIAVALTISACYGVFNYLCKTDRSIVTLAGVCLVMAGVCLVGFFNVGIIEKKAFVIGMSAITVFAISVNGVNAFDDIDGRLKRGVPTQSISENPVNVVSDAIAQGEDGEPSRFEAENITDTLNMAYHKKLMSTAYYFSVLNGNVSTFCNDYELNNTTEYRFLNMNSRSILNLALATKYILVRDGDENLIPYSYDEKVFGEAIGDSYSVYKTNNGLPFGYTYDSFITENEYEKMDGIRKQEALLQAAVINTADDYDFITRLNVATVDTNSQKLKSNIQLSEGVTATNNGYYVSKEGAELSIKFDGLDDSETYLELRGFDYSDVNPVSITGNQGTNLYEKLEIERERRNFIPEDKGPFTIETEDYSFSSDINNYRQPAYSGKHNYLYNTGYRSKGINEITFRFDRCGYYDISELSVICQPMDKVDEYVSARKEDSLTNIQINTNEIKGTIHSVKDEILCIPVPYSKGFTGYVDGVKCDVMKINEMFVGLYLTPGDHRVELKYETPLLRLGIIISCVSILIFIVLIFYKKKAKIR